MRKALTWIAIGCCIGTVSMAAQAATRKAGLWTITTTMTWQKSPFIPGTVEGPAKGGTHSSDVCLTQEMIDQWGALLPQARGQCTIANKVMVQGGMNAEWVCTGRMTGKGSLETLWTDLDHAKGKVHFVGTFLVGNDQKPIEWTTESTSVFKSADCGGVKPPPLPDRAP